MKGFTAQQTEQLLSKLDRARVHSREIGGKQIDYIEGWFAIAEANAIFGYAGWDREMAEFERVFERTQGKVTTCGYLARVRIRVRTRGMVVVREGTGFGHAAAFSPDEAHERALKGAETDATKRALATFGNRFGLGLYDKEPAKNGEPVGSNQASADSDLQDRASSQSDNKFALKTDDGTVLAAGLSPEAFCSGLRQLIEAARLRTEIAGLRASNEAAIAPLRAVAPDLKTARGKHYAEILEGLIEERAHALGKETALADTPPQAGPIDIVPPHATASTPSLAEAAAATVAAVPIRPSRLAAGSVIDKSVLALASPRRIRNKAHLARIGAKPCLICEEHPCHAHHVTFAQPRGLSVKVSDEYTVPLCALHHNEVHRTRPEEAWWRSHGVDPLGVASVLWQESLGMAELYDVKP